MKFFRISGNPYPLSVAFLTTKTGEEAKKWLVRRYPGLKIEDLCNRCGCSFWVSEDLKSSYRTYFVWILEFNPRDLESLGILAHEIYHTVRDAFASLEIREESNSEPGAYYFDFLFMQILRKFGWKKEKK